MAKIGEPLTAPEAGWKRYDDKESTITYTGFHYVVDSMLYNGGYFTSNLAGSSIKFNFTGTKLRLIGVLDINRSTSISVFIDGVKRNDFSQYSATRVYRSLDFDISDLADQEHCVIIINNATGNYGAYYVFDVIDIESTGTLKTYNPDIISIPLSPTNLAATAGISQITLSWTAVTGVTGYNVKRSTTAGGAYTAIATKVNGTTYIDNTVTNGITYYYVVTAIDGSGNESANSNEASATLVAAPVETGTALLQVTMSDSSEHEYKLSTAEIDGFVNWFNHYISTDTKSYMLNKTAGKEYLAFDKIISFEVIPLTK